MGDYVERLDKMIDILEYARKLAFDSYRMLLADHDVYMLVHRSTFLRRAQISFWQLAIIEISKLFSSSDKEHFRIRWLLDDMIQNYDNIRWESYVSEDSIKNWLKRLRSREVKIIVKDLIEMRKQHYAHTDMAPDRLLSDIPLYFEHIQTLFSLAKEILEGLNQGLNSSELVLQPYNGEDAYSFLSTIIDDRESLGSYILHEKREA